MKPGNHQTQCLNGANACGTTVLNDERGKFAVYKHSPSKSVLFFIFDVYETK
ncbi:hypothetical protein SAMN04489735_100283 [Aneurinibacillus thermoaerophilus]|uniref:Uncharacterized protein n=1 Tax=Aneurinibacillus thermoaerophilus TaxID=143495 RepID=A0A1G7WRH7_ANETH|nr:hypothetical protein SAMN04489735_100283 [Aneurinibacillus thermoaerophilus]